MEHNTDCIPYQERPTFYDLVGHAGETARHPDRDELLTDTTHTKAHVCSVGMMHIDEQPRRETPERAKSSCNRTLASAPKSDGQWPRAIAN